MLFNKSGNGEVYSWFVFTELYFKHWTCLRWCKPSPHESIRSAFSRQHFLFFLLHTINFCCRTKAECVMQCFLWAMSYRSYCSMGCSRRTKSRSQSVRKNEIKVHAETQVRARVHSGAAGAGNELLLVFPL